MLAALQRLGETWPLAANSVRSLKAVARIVFSTRDEDAFSASCSFGDSAMDVNENFSNPLWFDLFSLDDMQSNIFDK